MALTPRLARSNAPAVELSEEQRRVRDRVASRLQDGTYATEALRCFCGSAKEEPVLAERDRFGLPVTTVLCTDCGVVRAARAMTSDARRRFYAEDFRPLYVPDIDGEELFRTQREQAKQFHADLKAMELSFRVVYDVGCAAGGVVAGFKELGCDASGCSPYDDAFLAVGRAHGLDLVVGGARDLRTRRGGQQADLVILLHELQTYTDIRRELAEVVELVRPGGHLLVHVPGVQRIPEEYGGDFAAFVQNVNHFYFSGESLAYVITAAGLEVLHVDQLCLVVARRPEAGETVPIVQPDPAVAVATLRSIADAETDYLKAPGATP
jgi:SAM-dependent methyltransferase